MEKLNLFQEISPVRSRCQNWKDPRELLVQGPHHTDAEIEIMELKVDEDQMRFVGFFFFSGRILEQANGLRVKRGDEVVDKRQGEF